MNEYNRWISYLYEYVNGKKEENAGFLRMEIRGPQCRIRIGLAAASGDRRKDGRVFLLAAGEADERAVFLGTLPPLGTGREGGFMTRSENMAGSGMPWRAFSGIKILYEDSGREYRTYWDDRIQEMERRQAEIQNAVPEEPVAIPEEPPTKPEEPAVIPEEPPIVPEAPVTIPEEMPTKPEEPAVIPEEMPTKPEEIASKQEAPDDVQQEATTEYPVRSREPRITWGQLQNIYPKILPFGPADTWEVMRISLQDIGRLPREHWVLGANEFVIHGYYDHGHLALIRDEDSEFCFLGVPGDAMETDRRVAELFGFRQFRPAEKGGYWLTRIKL